MEKNDKKQMEDSCPFGRDIGAVGQEHWSNLSALLLHTQVKASEPFTGNQILVNTFYVTFFTLQTFYLIGQQ